MALITQHEPVHGTMYKTLDTDITNNDPGAIYDSGVISADLFGGLAQQLHALPVNQHYPSLDAMMAHWNFGITPSGNVYNGWSAILGSTGQVDMNHISGIPGLSYDQWLSTAGQNTMALTLRIPLSQLELDGIAGYNPATDAGIGLNTGQQITGAFVGHQTGGFPSMYGNANAYHVVPEPGTALLLVAGAAAIGVKRAWNKVADYFRK